MKSMQCEAATSAANFVLGAMAVEMAVHLFPLNCPLLVIESENRSLLLQS
jgi:hypothetical protein